MTRIVICGGPRTGKTTMAVDLQSQAIGYGHCPHCEGSNGRYAALPGDQRTRCPRCGAVPLSRYTDDLIPQVAHLGKDGWSEASRIASAWLDAPGPWIVEGVAMSRALRKWRDAHPGEPPPVDRVIRMTVPVVERTAGQVAMAKGEAKVWAEIEDWLESATASMSGRSVSYTHAIVHPSSGGAE